MGIVNLTTLGPDPGTITLTKVDNKVDPLATEFNGGIDNDNVASDAAIANSKLNLASVSQNVTLAGTNVLSGTTTLSGATTISGASTISGIMSFSSKILKQAKGADVASVAGAITLGDDGNYFDITGTNAITSITAKTAGTVVVLQFDSTASLVDGSNLKLNGNFTGAAEAQIALISDGTNWFEIARSNSSFTPTVSNALSGSVIQTVNTQTGAVATGSTAIPIDDSIPQNTEGDEYMTLAITPNNTNNKLKIDVVFVFATSAASNQAIALFQDATAGAIAAVRDRVDTGGGCNTVHFTHYMTAGTTSSTTFKVRAGGDAGTVTFNGSAGGRQMGGVMASSITIQEIKA